MVTLLDQSLDCGFVWGLMWQCVWQPLFTMTDYENARGWGSWFFSCFVNELLHGHMLYLIL